MPRKHEEIRSGVFAPQDIEAMRAAFLLAATENTPADGQEDGELLARAIIRLYKMGLLEPRKLGAVAALMTSSNLFRAAHLDKVS